MTIGLCPVCGKPTNASVPLFARCRYRGIKIGGKLILIPKHELTIKKGRVRGINVVKRLEKKRAYEFLKRQKKEVTDAEVDDA